MNFKLNRSALVQYEELVAVSKDNARWSFLNYIYLQFQISLLVAFEMSKTFRALPAAFKSQKELLAWADTKKQDICPIPGLSKTQALITIGSKEGCELLRGQQFVWVRAKSNLYRNAIIAWINTHRSTSLLEHHKLAAEYCTGLARALEAKDIRKNISDAKRKRLSQEFHQQASNFMDAAQSQQTAIKSAHLLFQLDQTLDADHVINRKSLNKLPEAWVMIAPVISGANQSFGRLIEAKATKFLPDTEVIYFDAITTLKLFAPTIPSCPKKANAIFDSFEQRFQTSVELNQEFIRARATLTSLLDGTVADFFRAGN